jgi:hypothetical protein
VVHGNPEEEWLNLGKQRNRKDRQRKEWKDVVIREYVDVPIGTGYVPLGNSITEWVYQNIFKNQVILY